MACSLIEQPSRQPAHLGGKTEPVESHRNLSQELVRFDTALLQEPELSGVSINMEPSSASRSESTF